MYLSHLLINVGDNPDRPRPGRLWLRNVYHVHQRLWMAFPTEAQRTADPEFLAPFNPKGFAAPRFLFRVDNSVERNCPRAVIVVLSGSEPNWRYAFQNARTFLAAEAETREYSPTFATGQEFCFRIRVNLSKKSVKYRKTGEKTDTEGRPRTQGKRIALTWEKDQRPDEVIVPWFARKGPRNGFELRKCEVIQIGWVNAFRPGKGERMKFRSALLEGIFAVKDEKALADAIAAGIGSAKAFGFGLLSVAPR